jgi:hypothetical protein
VYVQEKYKKAKESYCQINKHIEKGRNDKRTPKTKQLASWQHEAAPTNVPGETRTHMVNKMTAKAAINVEKEKKEHYLNWCQLLMRPPPS